MSLLVLALPTTQPYTPHDIDVFCPNGHRLTGQVFRISSGTKSTEKKIWARNFTPNVAKLEAENFVTNVPKTIERCKLDPSTRGVVTKVTAVCSACGDNRSVGTIYANYIDCSDYSVDCSAQRFDAAPLELMLLHKPSCQLQVRQRAATPLTPYVGVSGEVKDDAERLIGAIWADPSVAALLPINRQGRGGLVRQLELDSQTAEQRYILATSVAFYFSANFERLQTTIGICGDFLLGSGLPHPKIAKNHIRSELLTVTSNYFAQAVQIFIRKRAVQLRYPAIQFLCEAACNAQGRQMTAPPDDPFAHELVLKSLFVTRNAVAHSRDGSGCERRHLLRLFANAFGRGDVVLATEFVSQCIDILQLNLLSDLGRRLVAVVRCDFDARQNQNADVADMLLALLADAKKEENLVVARICEAVNRL